MEVSGGSLVAQPIHLIFHYLKFGIGQYFVPAKFHGSSGFCFGYLNGKLINALIHRFYWNGNGGKIFASVGIGGPGFEVLIEDEGPVIFPRNADML